MSTEVWLSVLGGLVLLAAGWAAWTLARLRRLARRVALAWSALDVLLQRRAAVVALVLARHARVLGPRRSAALQAAVAQVQGPGGGDREAAENALARAIGQAAPELAGLPPAVLGELADTGHRVGLARSFFNDAVRDTRALRGNRVSRVLRLHARRPLPRYFDIQDGAALVVPPAETRQQAAS